MTPISTCDILQGAVLVTVTGSLLSYGIGMKVAGVGIGLMASATAFLPILVTPIFTASLLFYLIVD